MRVLALVPAVVFLAGCVEDLKVVRLKADGSGTFVHTRRLKEWVTDIARSFGTVDEFTEEKARAKAATLGEGVEFVSAEKANLAGWEGMISTYSFKDVSTLKLEDDGKTSVRLEKLPNGNSAVDVTAFFKPAQAKNAPDSIRFPEDLKKALMSGLKARVSIEVEGTIVKCSSPHVTGSVLTVVEVDLDQLMAEEDRLKKQAARDPATLEEAKETIDALRALEALRGGGGENVQALSKALQKIKGFKHSLEPRITMEFTPK